MGSVGLPVGRSGSPRRLGKKGREGERNTAKGVNCGQRRSSVAAPAASTSAFHVTGRPLVWLSFATDRRAAHWRFSGRRGAWGGFFSGPVQGRFFPAEQLYCAYAISTASTREFGLLACFPFLGNTMLRASPAGVNRTTPSVDMNVRGSNYYLILSIRSFI